MKDAEPEALTTPPPRIRVAWGRSIPPTRALLWNGPGKANLVTTRIAMDHGRIEEFCRKWKIREFALFGSVLRDDFRPDSDVDVLVTLEDDAPWSLYEWVEMIEELESVFGRKVGLVEKTAIENPFRRRNILRSHEVVYAAK